MTGGPALQSLPGRTAPDLHDEPPAPPRRRGPAALRPVVLLAVAVLGAGATSVAVQLLVGTLVIPRPSHVSTALTALSVFVGAVIVAVVAWRIPRGVAVAGVVLPAAISTVVQALQLAGSRFYLFGMEGDQAFRMQYLGRFADSPALADGNFADLPSFYPPAWFWVGGRLAALMDLPAWVVYKPYSIATMAVAAGAAFAVWSRVVAPAVALVLATVTAVVGLLVGAYEPYAWVIAAGIPPLAVVAWRMLAAPARARRRNGFLPAVALGLFIGLAAATYTLLLGVFVLVLGVTAAAVVAGAGVADTKRWTSRARVVAVRLVPVAVVAAVAAAPTWSPYVLAELRNPSEGNGAARYLPEVGATFGAPMLEPTALGLLCLLGLAWIVARARRRSTAAAGAVVVVSCYAYYVLSVLVLALGTTLLSFKIELVLPLALACAGVLAVGDLARFVEGRISRRGSRDVCTGAAVIGVIACVVLVQTPSESMAPLVEPAFSARDDQGVSADDATGPRADDPGSWHPQLLATVDTQSGRDPADVVVLTSYWPIMDLRPYRGFQTVKHEYANPLGLYSARNAEIERWAAATDAGSLARALASSRFRVPDVFVLMRTDRGLETRLSENVFPLADGTRWRDVIFSPRAFEGPEFRRADVGPFAVITRSSP